MGQAREKPLGDAARRSRLGNDRRREDLAVIMSEHVNGRLARSLGWPTTVLVLVAAVVVFATGGV